MARLRDSAAPPAGTHPQRARLTLPASLQLSDSPRVGVFAGAPLPRGLCMGPYEGRLMRTKAPADVGGYSWRMRDGRLVDASDEAHSNWMRFVNCAPHADRPNLVGFQYRAALYYRTVAPVAVGEELLVYYGDDCARNVEGYYEYHPPREKPVSELAATGDGGSAGGAVNDYRDLFEKELKPKLAATCSDSDDGVDVYYHPIKVEPESGLVGGNGDDVNGYYNCGPIKREPQPELAATDGGGGNGGADEEDYATADDAVAHGCRDVGYKCSHCGISLSTQKFRIRHEHRCSVQLQRTQSQATKLYHCDYCRFPYVKEEDKERHQQKWCRRKPDVTKNDCKLYRCVYCRFPYEKNEDKEEHEQKWCRKKPEATRKDSEQHHCDYCKFLFLKKEDKEEHQQKWCRKKPNTVKKDPNGTYFECEECKFVTKWKDNMKKHILNHNKNNADWFTCTHCSYKTVHKRAMTRHMESHSDTFTCCCPICGESFKTKRGLDNHLLKQHSDEPGEVSKLITSKIYTCDICDKYRTTSKAYFREHVIVTHRMGAKCQKHQCPHCPYSTFRKTDFYRHTKTHLEPKRYYCTICKMRFSQKRILDSHVLSDHVKNLGVMKTITQKIQRCQPPTDGNGSPKEDTESKTNDVCYHPLKEEPEPCGDDGDVVFVNSYCKREPKQELAATDIDGGCGGDGDEYVGNIGVDVDDCYSDSDPPKENPEPELAAMDIDSGEVPEHGVGDGDAIDVDGYCNYDPLKEELEPVLAGGDDAVASGQDVTYDCCHCGVNLYTQKLKVEHETRCKVHVKQKELESQVTKLFHCSYCRSPFRSKDYKEQHQRKWCRKRPIAMIKPYNRPYLKCSKCEYVTKRRDSLDRHVLNHDINNAEWLSCTQCSYKTVHKSYMTKHMKSHDDSFSCASPCCPICGKSFQRKLGLDEHLLKQHSDEFDDVSKLISSKIYICNICDQFKTTLKTNFNDHVTVTHLKGVGCKKYECPHCPYSTFRTYYLKAHLKTHAKQKDYRCTDCKKQFTQKRELDSHILTQHADDIDLMKTITAKIHRCESCSYRTVQLPYLKKHLQSNHI